ncbi:hypothetical protein ACOME3_000725 [Neoechinorhynchus agilis]
MLLDLEWTHNSEKCKKMALKIEFSAMQSFVLECHILQKDRLECVSNDSLCSKLACLILEQESANISKRLRDVCRLSNIFLRFSKENGVSDEQNSRSIIENLNTFLSEDVVCEEDIEYPSYSVSDSQRQFCYHRIEQFIMDHGTGFTSLAIANIFWAIDRPQQPFSTWKHLRDYWGIADNGKSFVIPFQTIVDIADECLTKHKIIVARQNNHQS